MIPDLSSASVIVVLVMPVLLLIMLLPTVLELKKPRDSGPRLIVGNFLGTFLQAAPLPLIINIEENQEFDVKIARPISLVFGFLQNLDA
jgi:hypothetical protein